MAAEITHPLSVVDELFSRHLAAGNAPSLEWGEKMHFAHALGAPMLKKEQLFQTH